MTLVASVLTQSQIDQLRGLITTATNGNQSAAGTWAPVYQTLYSFITVGGTVVNGALVGGTPVAGVDASVWLWINGARFINNNEGPFADLIRQYTAIQYKLRYNGTLDFTKLNEASNEIAKNFIKEWIPVSLAAQSTAVVPNISITGNNDAGPVAAKVFNLDGGNNAAPWAGTIFFTQLGDAEFFQRWILDALRDPTKPAVAGQTVETGGYDLISVAQGIQDYSFSPSTGLTSLRAFLATITTATNLTQFDSIVQATTTAATAQFKTAYGIRTGDVSIDIGADIFGAVAVGTNAFKAAHYAVGSRVADKIQATPIAGQNGSVTTSGTDLIDGGRGNDTVVGSLGTDIIDGGDNTDTVTYARAETGLAMKHTVTFDTGGVFGWRAQIDKTSALTTGPVTRDLLYNVEKIVLSDYADTVTRRDDLNIPKDLIIDLGGGVNRIELKKSDAPATLGKQVTDYVLRTKNSDGTPTGPSTPQQIVVEAGTLDKLRVNSLLFVDGKQLVGGATFDFDKFDMISSGNVKPIWLMNSNTPLPAVTTDDRVKSSLSDQIAAAVKFIGGINGALPGAGLIPFGNLALTFAPILLGALAHFKESFVEAYSQVTIGTLGERYDKVKTGTDNGKDVFDLTITLRPSSVQGQDYKVVIHGWHQGDFGIQLVDTGFRNGLESGTNKNGQLDTWQTLSLSTIVAQLAKAGITPGFLPGEQPPPPVAARSFAAADSFADPGASETTGATRHGNDGNDELAGDDANNALRGEHGNDTLAGGDGRDIYVFAAGDGADVIDDPSLGGNVVRFLDIDIASITKQLVFNDSGELDLLVTYGSGDTILIKNWSTLSDDEQALWTFESVHADNSSNDSSLTPDLSVEPDVAGGVAPTFVSGTEGDDVITGVGIDEQIDAFAGNDSIDAGGGNDIINAGDGNDTVEGGGGNDFMPGGDGDDVLSGGAGNDSIGGGAGNDVIRGGTGNDYLEAGGGVDTYVFERGDGHDTISAVNPNTLTDDTLQFGAGINPGDIVITRTASDSVFDANPVAQREFTLTLRGTQDSVKLQDDVRFFGHGFSGDVDLNAITLGQIVFDNGVVWSKQDFAAQYFAQAATSGDDAIVGFDGNETFNGKGGNDRLYGYAGSDNYVWNRGDGNDIIIDTPFQANGDVDRLVLGTGITAADLTLSRAVDSFGSPFGDLIITIGGANGGTLTVTGYFQDTSNGIEKIAFADGTVWSRADIDGHFVSQHVTAGNDSVLGTAGNDSIDGGAGNDTISGTGGNDTMNGGAGNDRLVGSSGIDVYRFDANFGQDAVFDNGPGLGDPSPPFPDGALGQDRIEFTTYNLADFTFARAGVGNADLVLSRIGSTDQVTIEHFTQFSGAVEYLKFADGTQLYWPDTSLLVDRTAAAANVINGTASAELVTGTAAADRVFAGAGADTVNAGGGNDVVNAGDGDDRVNGETGDDILLAGAGNDIVSGGDGNDIVYADAGNDSVTGDIGADTLVGGGGDDSLDGGADNDSLFGNAGNDRLAGGTGADILIGGAGSDTYVFNRGDGQDVIQPGTERGLGETETLVLGGGITTAEMQYALVGNDLVISFGTTPTDRITVTNFLRTGTLTSIVVGATTLPIQQVLESITGRTAGADNVTPFATGENTTLLYGGRGNDTLTGDGTDDTYIFIRGDGQDRIDNRKFFFDFSNDQLFIDGYAPAEVRLACGGTNGLDLALTFTTGTDRIDINQQLGDDLFAGLTTIRFEDGTTWSQNDLRARVLAQAATVGNDSIAGFDGFDGNDDVLAGGLGNDTLSGGLGNDRYVVNASEGHDVIIDVSGKDGLEFGAGIRPTGAVVTRSATDANDVVITLSATDSITLKGVFADAGTGVETVTFADGTIWTKTDLANAMLAGKTTAAADTITGTFLGETLAGGLGNDTLSGGAGGDTYVFNRGDGQDTVIELGTDGQDRLLLGAGITTAQVTVRKGTVDPTDLIVDVGGGEAVTLKGELSGGTAGVESIVFADGTAWGHLDVDKKLLAASQTTGADAIAGSAAADIITGGAGNDTIDGRGGADVYVFSRGDGQDVISDTGTVTGLDRLEFGANIGAADIDLSHGTNPNDLVIAIRGTTDRITVANHFAAGGGKIGEIVLKDGTALFADDIIALAANHAPTVAIPITTKTVAQNAAFNFVVPANTFADSDVGDTITLKATRVDGTALPSWLKFDGTAFTGTPANADVGTPIQVRLTALDDAGDSVTNDFTINVTNVNDAPVSTALITNKRATVGTAFSFALAANQFVDPDNGLTGVPTQTLTYSAKLGSGAALPTWLTFNATTRTFSGTPATANQGAVDIVVTASDGTATATTRFGVFVGTTGNTNPTVGTAMATQNATEDAAFSFQVPVNAFADTTAGDRLRYAAALSSGAALPTWLVLDPITGLFTGTPGNTNVGTSTVRVTATDIFGSAVSANFTLRVNNVNDAPTANGVLSSFVTTQNAPFTYTIPAGFFTDVDTGDTLSLVAFLADGSPLPDWLVFNPATRTFSGTPANGDVGMLDIIVAAVDRAGLGVTSEMFILVNDVNDAPVVSHPLEALAVDRLQPFTFTVPAGTFFDDHGGVGLTARMTDGSPLPAWMTFDPITRTFFGTPDSGSVGDNEGVHLYRVAVIATDSEGAATTTIFNLAVRGPNPGTLIFGTEGSDTLTGTAGPDTIYGLGGNDALQGREGVDTYAFDRGFGQDTISIFYKDQFGNDIKGADDIISFGAVIAPSDVSVAFADSFGNPSIFFNNSDPTIIDDFFKLDMVLALAGTGDTIRIERQLENDRFVNFQHPIEEVHFADGTVWTSADLTAKIATGGAGNDLLAGDAVANLLTGGAGNDRLVALEGNDTLIGGTGNDDLYGGPGDDVYIFNLGDGQDRIMDLSQFQYTFISYDTLRFGAGIRPSDLQFVRDTRDPFNFSTPADGASLLVKIGGTTDSIKIYWQYAIVNDLSAGIDQFEFADGTVMNRAQIDQLVNPGNLIQGTDAAETLTGTAASETINGKKGNDLLQGADGNDTYIWNLGDGNDTIAEFGITSTDVVNFGIGIRPQDITLSHIGDFGSEAQGFYLYMTFAPTNEKLTIAWEFNTNSFGQPLPTIEEFRFSDGTVWTQDTFINLALASTPGNDIIQGFPNRPDTMDGGAGNDELHGQTGGDIYVFGRGYGNDTIYDALDGIFGNVVDRIQFNSTVSSTDVTISRFAHLVPNQGRVIDTVFSINGTTDKLSVAGANFGFESDIFTSIRFDGDNGFWSGSGLGARYLAANSTSGNDSIIGFAANELINTGLGNDTIDGGRGTDTLTGGAGSDTYVFYRMPDTKIIRDAGLVGDIDTLQLAPDILPAEVTITRANNENDLILRVNGGSDGVVILEGRLIGADRSADQIKFGDNTVWDFAAITAHTLAAAADARLVNGTAAAEALAGTDFAETFDSKAGADTITGGFGEDIYIWRTGYGNDIITEVSSSSETDTLKLRDLTSSQVTLLQSGNDLVILANPTGEYITVKDQFNFSGVFGLEEVLFSDRVTWDRNALSQPVGFAGTNLADSLLGGFGDDALAGLGGNDTIDGSFGNDTAIYSGNWRDYAITYNAGTSTFTLSDRRVGAPDGVDSVVNTERFQFADRTITVATPADLLNDAPTNITLTGGAVEENSGAGTVVGTLTSVDPDAGDPGTFAAISGAIDKFDIVGNQIVVKAGAVIDFETATSHQLGVRVTDSGGLTFTKTFTITVTDVDESGIIGTAGADTLTGTAGPDRISGFAGNDTLIGGGGADTLNGGSEFDVASYSNATVGVTANLTAPATNTGDAAGDVYSSIEGLLGSGLNDVLTGDLNANTIAGGAGNDTIDGGAGNDSLTGGTGNDVFIVDAAGDVVTENLSEGTDEVRTTLTSYTLGANLENLTFIGTGDFSGTGNTLANAITGGAGNDLLDGGTGSDTLTGGAGNDVYLVDVATDVVTEGAGAGTDEVRTALAAFTLAANIEVLTYTGAAAFAGTGNALDNAITGGTGNDTLDGGAGNDTLTGGAGNDVYVVDSIGDVFSEAAAAGTDEVRTTLTSFTLGTNFENLTYTGAGNFSGIGNSVANVITGGAGNDTLDGGAGADTLVGGAGNDLYLVDAATDVVTEAASAGTDEVRTALASYTLAANVENLTYTGAVAFTGTGNTSNNAIVGGIGNDSLDGGTGTDTLTGGLGNDTYMVDVATDVIIEIAGEGTDLVRTTGAAYTLGANVENLTYTGATTFAGTGNTLANVITGGAGNDTLDGGAGNDSLTGGAGNDVYVVDSVGDVLTEAASAGTDEVRTTLTSFTLATNFENLTFVGAGNFVGTGNTVANLITGGAGNDTLDGGTGIDTLVGGAGNDVYIVDVATDVITEAASAGTDEVRTALASYTLGTNLENLTYTGAAAFVGTGNTVDNVITGGAGADSLSGGTGNDTLIGGLGNDTLVGGAGDDVYVVDATGDLLTEAAAAGTDTVRTTLASFTLATNFENLTYIGTAAFTGTGNTVANILTGGIGNDGLNGGAGIDTMIGGLGNDVYTVDVATDVVTENLNEGIDEVRTALTTYTLGNNVENLTFTGTVAFTGTGNALNNVITGAAGADTLSGGAGDDTLSGGAGIDRMTGGTGNDVYIVDVATDVIVENLNEGTDEVRTALATFTLGTNVENLTFTGTVAFTGTGNTLNNTITGGAGADSLSGGAGDDILNGGAGADRLTGGTGNDIYVVDSATDVIVENATEGTDEVRTTLATYTLGTNLENLTYTGTAAFTGTGNTVANVITGGIGVDTINGAAGDDSINGGAGNDSLTGSTGNDTFVFNAGFGKDIIVDFTAGVGVGDVIEFHDNIFASFAAIQAASTQVAADVQITVDVSTNILLKNVVLANLNTDDFRFV